MFLFRPAQGRGLLCLLLAISFLFNPFLSASSSILGTIISHQPSFRATVAASELMKFAPQEKTANLEIPEYALSGSFAFPSPVAGFFSLLGDRQSIAVPGNLLVGNIWFRPPPAR
jgi:hypothetical protein